MFEVVNSRQQQPRVDETLVTEQHTTGKPAGETKFAPVPKIFPDIRFPDGKMMVWDYSVGKYMDAPVGYERTDVSPFVMGNVYVFPYPGDLYIPTDDELKRRKRHIELQWWETLLWMRYVLRGGAISAAILAVVWAGGYVVESIKVFRIYGAPKVAAAFGDILSVIMYLLAAAVGLLLLASFLKGAKENVSFAPTPGAAPTSPAMDQNIQINIGGQQFAAGGDPAQKFTNNF